MIIVLDKCHHVCNQVLQEEVGGYYTFFFFCKCLYLANPDIYFHENKWGNHYSHAIVVVLFNIINNNPPQSHYN